MRYWIFVDIMFLLCIMFLYGLRHGYFATNYGGAHQFDVGSSKQKVIQKIDSLYNVDPALIAWQKNQTGELFNPNHNNNFYFRIYLNGTPSIILFKLFGNEDSETSELLLCGCNFYYDFRNWTRIGDLKSDQRNQILTDVRNLLNRLNFPYKDSWAQLY